MIQSTSSLTDAALIRRLLGLAWRYRWGCFKIVILQLTVLVLGLLGIVLMGVAIDELRAVVQPGVQEQHRFFGFKPPESWSGWSPMAVIASLAGGIVLLAALRAYFDYRFRDVVNQLIQVEFVINLRQEVFDKLQRLSFRFFDANASSSLINRVVGDVQNVRMFVDQVVIQSVILILSVAAYLTYMVALHLPLTLACLATTPLLVWSAIRFSRRIQPAYLESRRLTDTMVQRIVDNVKGQPVIRAFTREAEEIDRFKLAKERVYQQKLGIFRKIARFTPTVNFLSQLNKVILLGYGGILVIDGRLALGTGLIAFATILNNFANQVVTIATITNSLQESLTSARRVFDVLDTPIEVSSPPYGIVLKPAAGRIAFENVTVTATDRTHPNHPHFHPILRNITFQVEPGQWVGIFGRTGSGKSTLLSLIPRFYDPAVGRVTLDGHDLRDLDLDSLRRNIGTVFQESYLFSHTIAENIAFGHPDATREQIERVARAAQIHDFILSLPQGYDTLLGEGNALSGGQRQKVAIARALLLEPPILLLDDPTASLDAVSEHEMLASMQAIMHGRTTFLTTHRLTLLRHMHTIIVLDRGHIVQAGSPEELASQPGPYADALRGYGSDGFRNSDDPNNSGDPSERAPALSLR